MKAQDGVQMSESFLLGSLLAVVGGFLDVHTYLLRGGVFANAETGNIVLLGLNLAEGNFGKALYYLIPILSFAGGILAAEAVKRHFQQHPQVHWRQIVVAAEFLILLGAAFVPQGRWDMAVNVAIAFLCAMQVETFRKVRGSAVATTMCTGNLRSGMELLWHYHVTRDRRELDGALRYYGIILFFIGGAALGAFLSKLWAERALLVCCGLLAAVFGLMFLRDARALTARRGKRRT